MSNSPRVLVVDDEASIRKFLRVSLSGHGYRVQEASTGEEALACARQDRPDLVVLDVGLPDLEGFQVVEQLRRWSAVPVLMLSVRGAEQDKIRALDAGADDYLTKPFGLGELLARVRAALRRAASGPGGEPVRQLGDLRIDLAAHRVFREDREVALTPREFDLLRVLVLHAGRVLTHRQILEHAWGPEYGHETHLLRVNVSNLRRKIEPDPVRPIFILTEPGVGYRLGGR